MRVRIVERISGERESEAKKAKQTTKHCIKRAQKARGKKHTGPYNDSRTVLDAQMGAKAPNCRKWKLNRIIKKTKNIRKIRLFYRKSAFFLGLLCFL